MFIGLLLMFLLLLCLGTCLTLITQIPVPPFEPENVSIEHDLTNELFKDETENIWFDDNFQDEFFQDETTN